MNHLEFLAFFMFFSAVFIAGLKIFHYLDPDDRFRINTPLLVGEAALLGSAFIIGVMVLLSILKLYYPVVLWIVVLCPFFLLLNRKVREDATGVLSQIRNIQTPHLFFVIFVMIFIFRNCYFLVDVDSHATYLFMQRVWLENGTSLFTSRTIDSRFYLPHFDGVPYSLGIGIFGESTLFPQMINLFWRLIVLVLVFGYTSYRFNGYYGLAAAVLVGFNPHIFYSGANHYVVINGAVIAFLFAFTYNLWESRIHNSSFRWLLSLIFLVHLMANKYQMGYVFLAMCALMPFVQPRVLAFFKEVWQTPRFRLVLLSGCFFVSLWYIKNFISTGLPTFPILAGNFEVMGWTKEKSEFFMQWYGGITPNLALKYASYLLIWPGIKVLKVVCVVFLFLPFLFFVLLSRKDIKIEDLLELCYWIGVTILSGLFIAIAQHQEPRVYRFTIAVAAFAAIYAIDFVFHYCLFIKSKKIIAMILIIFSFSGYKVIFYEGGSDLWPNIKDNVDVIFNRLNMKEAILKHYPNVFSIREQFIANNDKTHAAAWDIPHVSWNPSVFLLPYRPQVGYSYASAVTWDAYDHEEMIVAELKSYGFEWIMDFDGENLVFYSLEEYAQKAKQYERKPKTVFYPYDLPLELIKTRY